MQEPDSWLSEANEAEQITLRLAESVAQENVLVLRYGNQLLDELDGLCAARKSFDLVIIDSTSAGFLFPTEEMVAAANIAKDLLEVQGALVFVKRDKAIAFVKESPVGYLSFHIFDSFSQVYDYSTTIAKCIQQAMGNSIEIKPERADLSEQILLTAIPVLTTFGIKLKASVEGSLRRNLVLTAIDNYTPLNSIAQRLNQQMIFDVLLDEIKQLEKSGAIYPIFPKIPFLVQQFRSGKQFKLKDYLLESKMISREQLDDVLYAIQNTKGAQRLSLGAMCVVKGFLSARQLEIALQDQSFFGQVRESEKTKVRMETDAEAHMQSLIGNLRSTEPAGVLQNLASNRANGVVVVEYKDMTFKAAFETGKLTFARQGRLKGNAAVTEFVSVWKDGVFVFMERSAPADLSSEDCQVTRPIDKLLLDSALASDNIEALWSKLPHGPRTVIEKLPDQNAILSQEQILDPVEQFELNQAEIEQMRFAWNAADGLATIQDIIKSCDLTTVQIAMAVTRLLHYALLRVQSADIQQPLHNFRKIISLVSEKIGIDRSEALLRISMREGLGYSAVARVFLLGAGNEVGADLSAAKAAGLPLSRVVKALEDWQVKYIEHVSQELDKNVLRDLVLKVYNPK
jgi:hypothetical protein